MIESIRYASSALEILVEKRITGFPVIDDDWKLVGLVSDYDLLALDTISERCNALLLWLRFDAPCHFPNSKEEEGFAYNLQLIYYIADLLSIKGDTALHSDIFNVILKVLKQMNFPLDKCLALLWESRRVNHSLCVFPVSEAFIVALSSIYGKEAESFEFWLNCLQDSQTLSVVFKQNFSFLSSFSPLVFHQHKSFLQSVISVDEVKQVASDLVSMLDICLCRFLNPVLQLFLLDIPAMT